MLEKAPDIFFGVPPIIFNWQDYKGENALAIWKLNYIQEEFLDV